MPTMPFRPLRRNRLETGPGVVGDVWVNWSESATLLATDYAPDRSPDSVIRATTMIAGSSSDGGDIVGLLQHLKAERRTGCLTLRSATGSTFRLYLLFGDVYHAVGPTGDG